MTSTRGNSGWVLGEISSLNEWWVRIRVNDRLPREVGESLSLEVFQNRGDVAFRDVVSGHNGDGLEPDLILELFSNINDSMSLSPPAFLTSDVFLHVSSFSHLSPQRDRHPGLGAAVHGPYAIPNQRSSSSTG